MPGIASGFLLFGVSGGELVARYVLASDTLIDALQREARYTSIVNEGITLKCIDGKWVGISREYVGVSRHADRHQIEFLMTAIVRICRQLTGRQLLPERVRPFIVAGAARN